MKINSEDINLEFRNEYDSFKSVFYKGEPFTGILKDGFETISFKNGLADGEYTLLFKNGELQAKELYRNGETIESEWYHQNGVLSAKFNKDFKYTRWNQDGVIVQVENVHYFQNGQICHVYTPNCRIFYSPNGMEVYRKVNSRTSEGKHKTELIYNHELMNKWYYDLLYEIPCEHSDGNRIHWIFMWFWDIFRVNQVKFFEIMNGLLRHPDRKIVDKVANIIALQNFHKYIEPENESNQEAYILIHKYTAFFDTQDVNRKTRQVNL